MHFRNTFFNLAIASAIFLGIPAHAYMGYYAGVPNCEMGGSNALSKEEKQAALIDRAAIQFIDKELGRIDKSLKSEKSSGFEEYSGELATKFRKLKTLIGDENFAIFKQSFVGDIACTAECENKKSCNLSESCEPKRITCPTYVDVNDVETNTRVSGQILDENYATDTAKMYTKAECEAKVATLGASSKTRVTCPDNGISAESLAAKINSLVGVTNASMSAQICANPTNATLICRSARVEGDGAATQANVKACTEILSSLDREMARDVERFNDLQAQYATLDENLAGVDFYTEGSYCFECQQQGNRRFVDDRSGFRRTFDTIMPILGGAAAAYGGYRLTNEAVDRATNLGFTTNPAPSFLSYGWPMIMNGVYGGIASGIGSGMFQCGNTMGGFFPGGHNGMFGPFGMNGMMGQNSAFGYPFGQSPYGFPGMGGPFMPGLVGGYGAGPWGVGGNLGYGVGIPQIMGFPGGGAMGSFGQFGGGFGVPGMGGFGQFGGGFGVPGMGGFGQFGGGFGVPGMGGFGQFGGGFGVPGMGGFGQFGGGFGVPGIGGIGSFGLYSVPGTFGVAGGYGVPGVAGIAGGYGLAGGFGVPGAAGIAGIAGGYGVAGLYGSIGSSLGLQYQQQLIQQQMLQYQQQMSMLQQYQEYEINRQRTRSQLQLQLQQLQMQIYQLDAGGIGVGGIGTTFGTGVVTPTFPSPGGVFNPGGNPAR